MINNKCSWHYDVIDNEMDDVWPFFPFIPLSSDINENTISGQVLAENQWKIVFYDSRRLHSYLRSHQWWQNSHIKYWISEGKAFQAPDERFSNSWPSECPGLWPQSLDWRCEKCWRENAWIIIFNQISLLTTFLLWTSLTNCHYWFTSLTNHHNWLTS